MIPSLVLSRVYHTLLSHRMNPKPIALDLTLRSELMVKIDAEAVLWYVLSPATMRHES